MVREEQGSSTIDGQGVAPGLTDAVSDSAASFDSLGTAGSKSGLTCAKNPWGVGRAIVEVQGYTHFSAPPGRTVHHPHAPCAVPY